MKVSYEFRVSEKRKIKRILLDFSQKDFFHLAGFQHLKDVSLPRNRAKTVEYILNRKITDETLLKSKYYYRREKDEKNIRGRIGELRYLEEYLDTNNIIKIFSTKEFFCLHSTIDAEYIIESSLPERKKTVYIFLKERREKLGIYCIVSFFEKGNLTYGGNKLYWMLKKKFSEDETMILYQNPNYKEVDDNGEP